MATRATDQMAIFTRIGLMLSAFMTVLILPVSPGEAATETGSLCARQATATERSQAIPRHLLSALSLVESGRWDPQTGETIAWPWTVTARGKGYFLPSKAAAIEKVDALRAAGITSIDVGCMQINLHYHANAFDSLAESFDPAKNMAYAARFLKDLYRQTRSWTEAAGRYHSRTPRFRDRYKRRVIRAWQEAGARHRVAQWTAPKKLDPERSRALDEAFKKRRIQEREGGRQERRAVQLSARRAVEKNGDIGAFFARQEAQRMRRLKEQTQLPSAERTETEFAASRVKQLAKWRRRRPL